MASYAEFLAAGLALPSAEERITWGSDHTLRVNDKMFAVGSPGSAHVTVKASKDEQAELIAADPETFAVAAYVGRFGWVRVTLDRVGAEELRELLTEAWRSTAPKRLVRAYDAERGPAGQE